jgi:hypothetical protein
MRLTVTAFYSLNTDVMTHNKKMADNRPYIFFLYEKTSLRIDSQKHAFIFPCKINILALDQFWYINCYIKNMAVDFTELNKIVGVTDSFLFSKGGELVAPPLPYTAARILNFGREMALCAVILDKMRQEIDFVELIYEERRVIVKISQNFFILVVCESTTDTTLIKLTLNVMHEEIKDDKEIQRLLRRSSGNKNLFVEAQKESELQELLVKMKLTA